MADRRFAGSERASPDNWPLEPRNQQHGPFENKTAAAAGLCKLAETWHHPDSDIRSGMAPALRFAFDETA